MDASQIQELNLQMEAQLLTDPAIKQVKIVNLAPDLDSPDAQWTVVLALDSDASASDGDAVVVGRARKALRKKMGELGHKSLVPKAWSILAGLPVSAIDPSAVDEVRLRNQLLTGDEDVPPSPTAGSNTIADKIRRVVTYTLRLAPEDVDMDKSFAQLGGDSITAIEVMARSMEQGVAFHVLDLLQCESLNKLADTVANQDGPAPGAGQIPTEGHQASLAIDPPPYVPV
jgi:acyl carrier protein